MSHIDIKCMYAVRRQRAVKTKGTAMQIKVDIDKGIKCAAVAGCTEEAAVKIVALHEPSKLQEEFVSVLTIPVCDSHLLVGA